MEEERRNIQKVIDEVSHAHRSFRPGGRSDFLSLESCDCFHMTLCCLATCRRVAWCLQSDRPCMMSCWCSQVSLPVSEVLASTPSDTAAGCQAPPTSCCPLSVRLVHGA